VRGGRQDRERALDTYIREHFPPYAERADRRARYFDALRDLAQKGYPERKLTADQRSDRLLASQVTRENDATERRRKAWLNRKRREWDRSHPNPLTWEKRRELQEEFAKTYCP
jgi:hypothetical protein